MKWYEFKNIISGEKAEIYLYGEIVDTKWDPDDPDTTPLDFKAELDKYADVKQLDIFINSPGGSVFAGLAIYNMLKRHPANKTGYIDGISASIASVIMMACNKIVMPKTALMLIHKPLVAGFLGGNADYFLDLAACLDKVEVAIVEAYRAKTGLSDKKIREQLAKDEFMTAAEALKFGLVDAIDGAREVQAVLDGETVIVNGEKVLVNKIKNFDPQNYQEKPIEKPQNNPVEKPDYSSFEKQLFDNFITL